MKKSFLSLLHFGLFCMLTLLREKIAEEVDHFDWGGISESLYNPYTNAGVCFHTWFGVFPPNFAQVNLRVC